MYRCEHNLFLSAVIGSEHNLFFSYIAAKTNQHLLIMVQTYGGTDDIEVWKIHQNKDF